MHPLTKNIESLLKHLSTLLPTIREHSHEKHLLKGSEILLWETITEIDGLPIIPEKEYLWKYPVITTANHFRRLKSRYKKGGIPSVQQYLEWVAGLQKGKKVTQQMQALQAVIKTIAENS